MTSRVSREFKQEVVRVALTSGLSRRQIASDFDIGFSTLGRWIKEERNHVLSAGPQDDLIKENERLRKENIDTVPVSRLCQIMDVSTRGYRAYKSRPMSQRQRNDMILLAHIREQFSKSLCSYGRPRMTEELKELSSKVGHRRVGRLMRENGISAIRTRKHKVTTDSNHKFNIAPNLLD